MIGRGGPRRDDSVLLTALLPGFEPAGDTVQIARAITSFKSSGKRAYSLFACALKLFIPSTAIYKKHIM